MTKAASTTAPVAQSADISCLRENTEASGFAPADDGARWICVGGVTFSNAGPVLEASRTLPLPTAGVVDCQALHPVDSAAVAVLVALKRRAAEEGKSLTFTNITASLHTLADLYGVEELLVSISAPPPAAS